MSLITLLPQTPQGASASGVGRRNGRDAVDYAEGDTLHAVLTNVANGVATLRTKDDYSFDVPAASVKGNMGDTLTFKIIKKDRTGLSLKQILQNDLSQPSRSIKQPAKDTFEIKEFTKTIRAVGEEDQRRTETQQEDQVKMARAVARIQRAQAYLSDASTPSAMSILLESGLSMNKISFSVLHRVMHEAVKQPNPPADAPQAVQSLLRHGLPANEKNITALEHAWDTIPARADDSTIARLLSDEMPLTANQLYISRYSAPRSGGHYHDLSRDTGGTADWQTLAAEVQRRFAQEGMADTEANRDAARFLIDHDLPLDKAAVEKVLFLRQIKEQLSQTAFFDKAAECLAEERAVSDMALDDPALRSDGYTISLTSSGQTGTPRWGELVALRRTLAEAQLKYTTEAAARLSDRAVAIDTSPVRETLEQLKQMEDTVYSRYLRMAGADGGAEPVARMAALYDKLADIHPLTANVHADILNHRASFTVNGIHASVLAARAQAGYEAFATVPNPRYGDSFAAVRGQFAGLLTDMDIDATTDHIKAAFILSKNHMDVNRENLAAVREIDAKINAITDRLHPMIAAQMIKDGLIPADMHADEVLAYINTFNRTYGEDGRDKITRYIREMDDHHALDADTRKGMIAVYRMLHVIQRDGAAALGLAARQDTPLTLGGLMDLAKYYQQHKKTGAVYDRQVDDAFGYLESLKKPDASIRAIMESAATTQPQITYADLVADRFIDNAAPEKLRTMLEDVPGGIEKALSDYNAEAAIPEAPVPTEPDTMTATATLQTFVTASPELTARLTNRGIPATPAMLRAMERLSRSPRAYADALNELADESGDLPEDALPDTTLTPLREGDEPEQLYARLMAALETADADESSITPRRASAREVLALQARLNTDQALELPIRLNGRIAGLRLHVLNDRAVLGQGARVLLSIDTPALGTVRGYFTLDGGAADILLTAETPEASERLQNERDFLTAALKEAGIEMRQLRFETETSSTTPLKQSETAKPGRVGRESLSEHEYIV